jgi:hypothetical protein
MPANASMSRAMYAQCLTIPDYHPGDLWKDEVAVDARMKGFLPEAGAPSLRMVALVSEKSTILLLIQNIRSICHDYRAGKVEESDADLWLYNAETAIRKFQDELAKEALDQAAGGDVTKLKSISLLLTDLISTSRQDALIGEDHLSMAAWNSALKIFRTFYEAFVTTCVNQSFDSDIALALERQRSMLGMGGEDSDLHCAYRHSEAKWAVPDETVIWKTCGLAEGKWKLAMSGIYNGDGTGEIYSNWSGEYKAHYSSSDSDQKKNGTLTYTCQQDKICDCLKHPDKEECAGVDTSTVQYFILVKNTYIDLTMYSPRGNVHVVGHDPQYGSILWQAYPVKRINVDKPCTPDDASEVQN